MKKLVLGLLLSALLHAAAFAQSNPGFYYGFVPTAGQWNSYFSSKQDYLGYVPLSLGGGTMIGPLIAAPPTSVRAGFVLPSGTAPACTGGTIATGSMWTTSGGFYGCINSVVYGPFSATAVLTIGGTVIASGNSGYLLYDNAGHLDNLTLSGDCTFSAPSITCLKTGGNWFGALATVAPGTGVATALSDNVNATGGLTTSPVPAASGGAGTINGALKGNGSGTVSQAACADLSNDGPYCPALVGQLPGTATNDAAAAGDIGELMSSTVNSPGSGITTGVSANVTSLSLTAGDWDVTCTVVFAPAASTNIVFGLANISTVTGTVQLTPGAFGETPAGGTILAGNTFTASGGPWRESLATTTTIYCVQEAAFTVSTTTAYGVLRARRVR